MIPPTPVIQVPPRRGYRYRITTEFEAIVLTQWLAPFTDGYDKTLPLGLEFIVVTDPPSGATAVAAKPDPYKKWESVLVDVKDTQAEKYDGYSLVIPIDRLVSHCFRC
jgi:hypothetical protein